MPEIASDMGAGAGPGGVGLTSVCPKMYATWDQSRPPEHPAPVSVIITGTGKPLNWW